MLEFSWMFKLLNGQILEIIPKDDEAFKVSMQYAIFDYTKRIYNELKPILSFELPLCCLSQDDLKIDSLKECYKSYIIINLMKLFGQREDNKSSIYNNKNDGQDNEKKLFYDKYSNDFENLRILRNKIFAHFDFTIPSIKLKISFIESCLEFLEEYYNRHPIIKIMEEKFKP